MRVAFRSFGLAGVTVAAMLTASCSSFATSPATQAGEGYRSMVAGGARSVLPVGFQANRVPPSWMKPPPHKAKGAGLHIAVAEFGSSNVLWFPLNDKGNKPPVSCEPASSTNGIAVDRVGNLWVPDGIANATTEYAPKCGGPILTIPDTTGEPADVGFDGNNRVYVLNINNASGRPTVGVYNVKTGVQVATLSDLSFNELVGIGTDLLGNVYVSNLDRTNVGTVIEFPGGAMPGRPLQGVRLGLPGAPAFDDANNLVIADWKNMTIDVFAPPYTGAPSTAPLMGASIWCKFSRKIQHLYCGDAANGSIDVYAYPGYAYEYSYTSGLSPSQLVTGIAPVPPADYGNPP